MRRAATLPTGETVHASHRPGSAAPLVLVHGAAGHRDAWNLEHDGWGEHEVWAVSLPGRPGSPAPPAGTAEAAARWLEAALEALEVPAATWVGHSFGGAVALEAARLSLGPTRMALVATAARLKVGPALLEAAAVATEPMPMDAAFGPTTPKDVIEAYAAATASVPPATALADWRACDVFDCRSELSGIQTPALVLYASADVMTPAKYQPSFADALPNGRALMLPESVGHMIPWEAEDAFVEAVTEFARG